MQPYTTIYAELPENMVKKAAKVVASVYQSILQRHGHFTARTAITKRNESHLALLVVYRAYKQQSSLVSAGM